MSILNFIIRVFFGIIEKYLIPAKPLVPINKNGYQFVCLLEQKNSKYKVCVYKNSLGEKVLIKQLSYKLPTLAYNQLINEARVLSFVNKYVTQKSSSIVQFPELISLIIKKNSVTLIRKFIDGKTLSSYPISIKFSLITQAFSTLKGLSKNTDDLEKIGLPKKSPYQIFVSYPVYFVLAIAKDIRQTVVFLHITNVFIKCYLIPFFSYEKLQTKYIFSHRDLHLNNIIIQNNKAYIIDMGISLLAEETTDLARIAQTYYSSFGIAKVTKLIFTCAKTPEMQMKFLGLTIYYTLQMLATENPNSLDYKHAKAYTKALTTYIIPLFMSNIAFISYPSKQIKYA